MLTLAFGILLFLLFVVTGGILVCALRVPEETTQRQSFSLALPLIGAIFLLASVKHFF